MTDLELQKQRDMEVFEQEIKNFSKTLPNYRVKEFTFSLLEQQLLAEQQTIISLATQTQNKIINEFCLKRVGIEPSPAINIRYAIGLGRFVCFLPRLPKVESKK